MLDSDRNYEGLECTPASGAQGTVKHKVNNSAKKGIKRSNTSTAGKATGRDPSFKLQLLDRKLKHDRMRQDAAFAAELLKNPSLSHVMTSHAEDIVLAFLERAKGGSKEDFVSRETPSPSLDSSEF